MSALRALQDVICTSQQAADAHAATFAALVITVRAERDSPMVLLCWGSQGLDVMGFSLRQRSRETMLKHMDAQAKEVLGPNVFTFLAFEEVTSERVLRFYACPLGYELFSKLNLRVELAREAADLQNIVFDKDNPPDGCVLATVTALQGLACSRRCLAVLAAVDTMRSCSASSPGSSRPQGATAAPQRVGARAQMGATASAAWDLRKRRHDLAQRLVQLQFVSTSQRLALEGFPKVADELQASADRVGANGVTHVDDVPEGLRRSDRNVSASKWRCARFSPTLEAPVTAALPQPQPQRHTEWRPSAVEALLTPLAWTRAQKWFEGNARDLEWMREHGAGAARPYKQQPLALAQSDMVPEARGIVWDLRRADDGIIEPWDFTAPIKSDLNLDFLKVLLSSCPDRELVSHLTEGVQFKADLPLQTVLQPHLAYMAPNVDLCQREIERLRSKGWSSVFAGLPALPCRLLPCGSVERKSEQKRPRRTVNASAPFPEDTWVDADGKKVESLNAAIKRPVDAPSSVDANPAGAASGQTSTWASGVPVPNRAGADTSTLTWEAWRATCSAEGLNALTAPNRPVHLRASSD